MALEITAEFIEEQKAIKENFKKGGPYSESDRKARRVEVCRLHFELGQTAASIAKAMNVNEKTIYEDIKFLNKKLANELSQTDPYSIFMTQLKRFEVQRTRLIDKLDKSSDDNILEKMISDLDARIATFTYKIFDNEERVQKKAVEFLNQRERENGTDTVWRTRSDLYCVSRKTQNAINKLIEQDLKKE